METSYDYIKRKIAEAKDQYPELRELEDHQVFIHVCIKYFFYEIEEDFNIDDSINAVVDGSGDGGIDTIFNDPNDDNDSLVIVQSKYYSTAAINKDLILSALYKIRKCISDIKSHRYSNYNREIVSRLDSVYSEKGRNASIRVMFLTPYDPRMEKSIKNIEKAVAQEFADLNVELKFGKDICKQIENIQKSKPWVEDGDVKIDKRDNFLTYGDDAVIVNISAQSLATLYHKHDNSLLGYNLRYYIRNKNVDTGIDKTINDSPDEFWYRNNGITLICDDYAIDGKVVRLKNFSIINGGQTTYKISKADIERDFYLLCKIVKRRGTSEREKENFVVNISQATNAQKPIKLSDLVSNTPEQTRLKGDLRRLGVCYITKRGEKADGSGKHMPYQVTTIQKFGKLALATILQQPGRARNNQTAIFKNDAPLKIFNNPNVNLMVDLLRVEYYYELYKKNLAKNVEPKLKSVISNGATYHLASVTYLCVLHSKRIDIDKIFASINKPDEILKLVYRATLDKTPLFANRLSSKDEFEAFSKLFEYISQNILLQAYYAAQEREPEKELLVTNFYKLERTYVDLILKRLTSAYTSPSGQLRKELDVIFGVSPKEEN